MESPLVKMMSTKEHAAQSAALFILDAMDGTCRIHPQDGPQYRRAHLLHLKVIHWVQLWSVLALVLHFFERPLWCTRWMATPELAARLTEPCENDMYPSYPVHYLSESSNFMLELVLLLPLAGHSLLLRYAQGPNFWNRRLQVMRVALYALNALDMLYAYSTPDTFFRFAPYLRVGFVLLYSTATRRKVGLVLRALPAVLSIFTVILCALTFFSWIGVLCFPIQDDDNGEGATYFYNLGGGMWSLYILITTANFPDVMMPAYKQNRFVIIFFAMFIFLGCFFLMNVLTAVVYNEYGEQRSENKKGRQASLEANLTAAFDLLKSSNGRVSRSDMFLLFEELNYYQNIAFIGEHEADNKFTLLDKSHSGDLTEIEFKELGQAIMKDIAAEKKAPPNSYMEVTFPALKDSKVWNKLGTSLSSGNFDRCVDVVLVLNAALLVRQSWGSIVGDKNAIEVAKDAERGRSLEGCITIFYFLEAVLKILVQGWTKYTQSPKNQFDFVVTVCTTATAIYVVIPNEFNSLSAVRYISMLRLLRILRLLGRLRPFQLVAGTFIHMMPQAVAICKVLCVVLYVFAVFGCWLFGGVINTDPDSPYGQRLKGTAFETADYYTNNFNDLFSGVVVLFELLVVNNWFVLAGGFADACDNLAAYAYFVVFHMVGVCCCLNIVVAFIIEAFLKEYGNVNLQTAQQRLSAADSTKGILFREHEVIQICWDGRPKHQYVQVKYKDKQLDTDVLSDVIHVSEIGFQTQRHSQTHFSSAEASVLPTVAEKLRGKPTRSSFLTNGPAQLNAPRDTPLQELTAFLEQRMDSIDDPVEVLRQAMPLAFEESVRKQPGFQEGISILALVSEALTRHSLAEAARQTLRTEIPQNDDEEDVLDD